MADEAENKAAEEVPESTQTQEQAPATEVQDAQSQAGADKPAWKVGDTTYDDPGKMAEAFRKFQGEYTRVSQERAQYRDKAGASEYLITLIKSDPELLRQVQARMNQGQTQEQAVRNTAAANAHDPRVEELAEKLDRMEMRDAKNEFSAKHKDLKDADYEAITDWIRSKGSALENWSYGDMLDAAYHAVILPKQLEKFRIAEEQKTKEEEARKGPKLLGSQASTSNSKAMEIPKGKLSSKQERDLASKVWQESSRRK